MDKQLDLFNYEYNYDHLNSDRSSVSFDHLDVGLIDYDPLNKPWHRWVSDKWKVFTKQSLKFNGLSYSDMSRGY